MLDFLIISTRIKKNATEIYPRFVVGKSNDLMIRGGDFYAIWDETANLWSTDEDVALRIIDTELDNYYKTLTKSDNMNYRVLHMWDSETGMVDIFHKYCQKQMRDNFHMLDEKLIFSNMDVTKEDYASKRLSYPLADCETPCYDQLMSVLYSEEERHKLEWAIGSIVTGDSKTLQKFIVLYGSRGTGKSTVLNIIQDLFEGYYSVFDAKALGSANNRFALEPFRTNPLVAIQHDGDLSHIEDNTRLNSLVSHELMTVDEKFKSGYSASFKAFLFMGTNKPVKITDAKSGLLRRLIDVSPTGNKINVYDYIRLTENVKNELGGIAVKCRDIYLADKHYYDSYIPLSMMGASNDFYNFVVDSYPKFEKENGVTLKVAWEMYKNYCEDAKVSYPFSQRVFKEELKNYFAEFHERYSRNGETFRNYYREFKTDQLDDEFKSVYVTESRWVDILTDQKSILDDLYADCKAQYANDQGTPTKKWDDVTTVLADLDTSKLHYVKLPENHIVIDFDLKDENGEKSLELNLGAASKWPKTYLEVSKSGKGIHLHYIYDGDVSLLAPLISEGIEIKTFKGGSALRRLRSKCINIDISHISDLPQKGVDKVVNFEGFKNEKALRTLIIKNLHKEYHPNTKPSIDFIFDSLEKAYNSGMKYDVSDMKQAILTFALCSTNNAEYCVKKVSKMKFKSEDLLLCIPIASTETFLYDDTPICFFDIEVFPNLFVLCYQLDNWEDPVALINPKPSDLEKLCKFKLVGFNNRRYDNHIVYAAMIGYSNLDLFNLSQKIINTGTGFFGEAYNLSYTDIYDFASAGNKKSLKKLEIEMGIHHQELGIPWDEEVPEDQWETVADYCGNDVRATKQAFYYLKADWTARQILADLADMTVNDTTNTLTTKIIFGSNRKPQSEFCYRDLSKPVIDIPYEELTYLDYACPNMMKSASELSLMPYFSGYKFENGISTYKGYEVGEGGFVWSRPGVYGDVALLDITSMHPHSIIAECLFGPRYTRVFKDLVDARVHIKHKDWDILETMLDGKLVKYVDKIKAGEITEKDLANGLKTAINSVYGLTSAHFDNPFRDPRNVDNIVAKRGALFMVDLLEYVQSLGYQPVHIKTDSIKIANADQFIIDKVMEFGEAYGYHFEHEATYNKMCLVNDAVYVAMYDDGHWTATGKEFQIPYVFKTLFTHEPITFSDVCETFSVKTALYLDMNEKYLTFEPGGREPIVKPGEPEKHDYKFVGKVGAFCPVKPGLGGGVLLRQNGDKYDAATGSKGYRWVESEIAQTNGMDIIDYSYYDNLVKTAKDDIGKYFIDNGDWFCSSEKYDGKGKMLPYELPF